MKHVVKDRPHSDLGASGAERWLACPGSVAACQGLTVVSSVYADEGSAAHYVAEWCISHNVPASSMLGQVIHIERGGAEIEVDEDMVEAVQTYLDRIATFTKHAHTGEMELFLEETIKLPMIAKKMFGTLDFGAVDIKRRHGYVIDFKYGKGHGVSAANNPQLLYYATCLFLRCPVGMNKITMEIIQPRYEGSVEATSETIAIKDLTTWIQTVLMPGAKAARTPGAPLVAGAHCRWCPAVKACAAHADWMMQKTRATLETYQVIPAGARVLPGGRVLNLPDPRELSPEVLVDVLALVNHLVTWAKEVEGYAQTRAERGEKIPGFKLVAKRSNRKWSDAEAAAKALQAAIGEAAWKRELLSPAQAEKILKKEKKTIAEDLVEKPFTGYHLVPESDPRPGVEVPAVEEVTKSLLATQEVLNRPTDTPEPEDKATPKNPFSNPFIRKQKGK